MPQPTPPPRHRHASKTVVETLTSELLARATTQPPFSLAHLLTPAQCERLLLAAYTAEVTRRRRRYDDTPHTRQAIADVAAFLTDPQTPRFGLMLCGTCGNGKTTLLYALQRLINRLAHTGDGHGAPLLTLPRDRRGEPAQGLRIIDAKDLADLQSSADRADRLQSRALRDTPLLAIEDMGREPLQVLSYGNAYSPVTDLIEARYNRQLFTVITTNLTGPEIRERYRQRLADRFNEMLHVTIFRAPTFRTNPAPPDPPQAPGPQAPDPAATPASPPSPDAPPTSGAITYAQYLDLRRRAQAGDPAARRLLQPPKP